MEGKTNRLGREKSPYLLQHARNPVDWWPWGEDAIKKAKNDGKPIFLSIGYSTCHWCHVLAHESFEDATTAALINKNFIPIKVDREEHPEIDSHYMAAVQAMTGQGGWPLSVFLTPDLRPFYGGTYFPPEPRNGMPSFRQVLEFVARLWKEKREDVAANAERVADALREEPRRSPGKPDASLLEAGYAALLSSFDVERGGFGGAPKFPLPTHLTFLLRYHFRTGKDMALTAVRRTLNAMAAGGIRDHLGGGFHRYSTDRAWLVPHFEKMLYDNALLTLAYLEGYQVTGDPALEGVAREALGWMQNEMMGDSGGFYSAQDADTPEGEGVFYSWTPAEVAGVLGKADGQDFCGLYGVTEVGNFEGGRSILHLEEPAGNAAAGPAAGEGALASRVKEWKARLYAARLERARPAVDDKVLTSWNGLAISVFARAGLVLGEEGFTRTAARAAEFVTTALVRDGRLLRRYRDGESAYDGTLEDHAFLAQGLLDLFETAHGPRWLKEAKRLMGEADALFWDARSGGYFGSADARFRSKEAHDGPTPSGNSVAASNLIRLWALTGEEALRAKALDTIGAFQARIEEEPAGHTNMLSALDLALNGIREVVVTSREMSGAQAMVRAYARVYAPDAVLVVADAETYLGLSAETNLLEGREPRAPAGYVCRDFACGLPARDEASFSRQLSAAER